jgi:hypothetical protein
VTGLSVARPSNGMSLSRVPRSEIAQWERDEGLCLERWERRALLQLDAAFCAAMAPASKSSSPDKSTDLVEEA